MTEFSLESQAAARTILRGSGPADMANVLLTLGSCAERDDMAGANLVLAAWLKGRGVNLTALVNFARTNKDDPSHVPTLDWMRDTLLAHDRPVTKEQCDLWQKDAGEWVQAALS